LALFLKQLNAEKGYRKLKISELKVQFSKEFKKNEEDDPPWEILKRLDFRELTNYKNYIKM
jgi:hypothetical protein